MDNRYQIYTNNDFAVINIRGSTAKKISWLENIYSAMIPAKGKIIISKKTYHYSFAKSTIAAVHAGYAIGLCTISDDIID